MKKLYNAITLLLLTFTFCTTILFGQNSYKFIEPNISISYDSNYFKIGTRYSNTFYETEAYDFSCNGDKKRNVRLHIKADHPIQYPSKPTRDSLFRQQLNEIKDFDVDTFAFKIITKELKEINNFNCFGYVAFDKKSKQYGTVINCYNFSPDDYTEVRLSSKGKDLDEEFMTLTSFLNGFRSYSKDTIAKEDSIIKHKYTVLITSTNTKSDVFKFSPMTYSGIASIKEKLEHRVSEVRLTISIGGQQIFSPDETGQVPITSRDDEKGEVIKNGEFVLLNSFGKKVKLPFTFTYTNKGPL